MSSRYAPQRRTLLALQHDTATSETGLIAGPRSDVEVGPQRQVALSVPESVRALGEPLEPFFDACGGRQAISLSVCRRDGRRSPETSVFQQPFVLIGRCPESDLALTDDGAVSFRHYYLQLVGGRWLFVDMPGVSGQSIEKGKGTSGWFDVGTELAAGRYSITRVAAEPHTAAQVPARLNPELPPELPAFELELVNGRRGSRGNRTPRISSSVTLIGASRQCDIWLKDDSVSKVHASLVLTPQGLWIVDLLGRDGVLVEGRPVYWKQLHDGTEFQIGRIRMRVRFGESRDRSAGRRENRRADRDPGRTREPGTSSGGSMSEGSVLALVQHLTDMQAQFFEHSQLQTQLITEMLSQLGRAQQTSVREDLARIDEIGRELAEIKTQMTQAPEAVAPVPKAVRKSRRPAKRAPRKKSKPTAEVTPAPVEADVPMEDTAPPDCAEGRDSNLPSSTGLTGESAGAAVRHPPQNAGSESPAGAQPPPVTADSHAWLSQRMANLAQERNGRWRHILNVFAKKPDPRNEESSP